MPFPAYTTEPAETTKDYILVNFLRIIIYFFFLILTIVSLCTCTVLRVYICLYGTCLNTVFMSM